MRGNLFLFQSSKAMERKGLAKPPGFEGESGSQGGEQAERGSHGQEELGAQVDCLVGGTDPEESPSVLLSRKSAMTQFEGKALGLDKAILHSIDCCGKKIKLYFEGKCLFKILLFLYPEILILILTADCKTSQFVFSAVTQKQLQEAWKALLLFKNRCLCKTCTRAFRQTRAVLELSKQSSGSNGWGAGGWLAWLSHFAGAEDAWRDSKVLVQRDPQK